MGELELRSVRDEEEEALQAIYPGALVRDGAFTRLQAGRGMRVTLLIPQAYPSTQPSILASEGIALEETEAILQHLFHGEVVLYEFLVALLDRQAETEEKEEAHPVPCAEEQQEWTRGDEIVDRKSVFVAHCTHLLKREEVSRLVQSLQTHLPGATHHIVAWRLPKDHDYDDGGERGAGLRLAGMLELMKVEHVLVVASRWYGGVQLGPQRFKHINESAQSALRRLPDRKSPTG